MLMRFFFEDEGGATSVEYALLASLAAIMAIGALTAFGDASTEMFNEMSDAITGAMSG